MLPSLFTIILSVSLLTGAAPNVAKRQAITALSSTQITAFTPYSFFAAAGYCSPSTTINWSCGTDCASNPGFVPIASGGDGDDIQFCKCRASVGASCRNLKVLRVRGI